MTQTRRVAVVQAASAAFNCDQTVEKVRKLAGEAAAGGAGLVLFPEAFISGYPRGISFGTVIGDRTAEGRDQFRRYWESSIEIPGPVVDELAALAAELGIHIVVGVVERDLSTLYDTALFLSPDGYLGKHRKVMPTAAERLVWGFGDGSTLPVFDTPFGRLGAVLCWENYMPLLRMAMYAKGVQLYCAPTADDRDTWLATMRHVALEGRCFVLSACQHLRRGDCPPDYAAAQRDDPGTVLMRGGSCIVAPLGQVLAGPCFDGEGVLVADLDRAEIARGKYDFDVAGHYARPDVFRLSVNERPARAVTWDSEQE